MAECISNEMIQHAMHIAMQAGAIAGKVSGAGGGGFIIFVVDPCNKKQLGNALKELGGSVINCQFSEGGPHGWKIYE